MSQPAEIVARPHAWRRVRKRTIALIVLALSACAAIFGYYLLHTKASYQLQREQAIAARDDPHWRLRDLDLHRISVADSENSALQVMRVQAIMPRDWPRQKKVPSPSFEGGTALIPDLVTRLSDVPPDVKLDRFTTAELRRDLDRMQPAVIEARKLATMSLGRPPLRYLPNPAAILLPQIDHARSVGRLLRADVALRVRDGDPDGALDSCRALLNVARSLGDEPFLMSQQVRVAVGGSACAEVQRVLAQGEPSETALAEIQGALVEEAKYSMLLVAMRGERATMNDEFEKLTTGELDLDSLAGMPRRPKTWSIGIPTVFIQYNHALLLNHLNLAVEIAERPDSEHLAAWGKFEEDVKPSDNHLLNHAAVLTTLYTQTIKSAGPIHLRHRATLSAAMTIVACERHRLVHGAFPTSFEAIDPKFREGLLGDPYVGGPLQFKVNDDGMTVYAVGQDCKDDGGKLAASPRQTAGFDVGFRLWKPSARRKRPKNDELPANVFQSF